MKKVRIYTRANRPSVYVEWREPVKVNGSIIYMRRNQAFPSMKLAKTFRDRQFIKINSELFPAISNSFDDALAEYMVRFDIEALSKSTKLLARTTIEQFKKISGPFQQTKDVTQQHIDYYTLECSKPDEDGKKLSGHTINKKLRQLKAYTNWLVDKNYHNGNLKYPKVKVHKVIVKALRNEQIATLLSACPSLAWKVRILLSIITGLRKTSIDTLLLESIDLNHKSIDSKSDKTGKVRIDFPLPDDFIILLRWYIRSLPKGQIKLFVDTNIRKTWENHIRKEARLEHVTRQNLRQTASTIYQKIGSLSTASNLLEHTDSKVTQEFYTDDELIMRWKVNQLPIRQWLGAKEKA